MGVMGDTIDEFKKAKTPEKVVIVGASVAALGIALYLHYKSQQTGPVQSAVGSQSPSQPQGLQYNTGNYPYLPANTQPLLDSNGNVIGFEPGNPTPGRLPPQPSPGSSTPQPGSFFLGPTGVKHYVATGNQSLSQIADMSQFAPGSTWNSIYAIPANQQLFGQMNYITARNYVPKAGTIITVPGNTQIPSQGGGAFGTAVLGQRRARVAPTHEGKSYVARVYSRRPA